MFGLVQDRVLGNFGITGEFPCLGLGFSVFEWFWWFILVLCLFGFEI